MNILITGATGFVGSHLKSQLLEDGYTLHIISRNIVSPGSGIIPIMADLGIPGFSKLLPKDIDFVIHLAQSDRYRDFPEGVYDMLRINIDATLELLEWSRITGVKKFIFTSSANVYAPSSGLLTEESLTIPISFYGSSKLSAEFFARQYQNYFQVDILRCFTVYGPGQKNMLIANLIDRIKKRQPIKLAGGIGLFLTPVFVGDLISVIISLLMLPKSDRTLLINVCGEQVITLKEIVSLIELVLGANAVVELTDDTPLFFTGSNGQFRELFPYFNLTSMSEGIEKTISKPIVE